MVIAYPPSPGNWPPMCGPLGPVHDAAPVDLEYQVFIRATHRYTHATACASAGRYNKQKNCFIRTCTDEQATTMSLYMYLDTIQFARSHVSWVVRYILLVHITFKTRVSSPNARSKDNVPRHPYQNGLLICVTTKMSWCMLWAARLPFFRIMHAGVLTLIHCRNSTRTQGEMSFKYSHLSEWTENSVNMYNRLYLRTSLAYAQALRPVVHM